MNALYYNEVLRLFEDRRFKNKRKQTETIDKIYASIPRVKEIDSQISSISVKKAYEAISKKDIDLSSYKNEIQKLKDEKAKLLTDNGYHANSMDMIFSCDKCKDMGFINGKKCSCFEKELINRLYCDSHVDIDIENASFDKFVFDYYSNEPASPNEVSPLQNIQKVVQTCIGFTKNFDSKNQNLLIYGKTGVGKTFLTNCIANELINSMHSVVYVSAVNFFDIFFNKFSNSKDDPDKDLALNNLFEADLLIIDDLGTEATTSYTASHLFNCLNERLLTNKSTVISTNLSLEQFQAKYSDRIFSRIVSSFTVNKIIGEDIRIMKKNWRTN